LPGLGQALAGLSQLGIDVRGADSGQQLAVRDAVANVSTRRPLDSKAGVEKQDRCSKSGMSFAGPDRSASAGHPSSRPHADPRGGGAVGDAARRDALLPVASGESADGQCHGRPPLAEARSKHQDRRPGPRAALRLRTPVGIRRGGHRRPSSMRRLWINRDPLMVDSSFLPHRLGTRRIGRSSVGTARPPPGVTAGQTGMHRVVPVARSGNPPRPASGARVLRSRRRSGSGFARLAAEQTVSHRHEGTNRDERTWASPADTN